MNVYKVKFGLSCNSIDESWIVRGRNFAEAANKAVRVAKEKDDGYTTSGRGVVSMECLGTEEK